MTEHRVQGGLHLHLDAESGCAGDMFLAAALDLGCARSDVESAFDAVGIGAERLTVRRIDKGGIMSTDVRIDDQVGGHDHAHPHDHTHYTDIVARITGAGLAPEVKRRALDIFERLAIAEAALHGTTVEKVAFHEVGAIDSIADVVGAAVVLGEMRPVSVSCVRVAMGHGKVKSAHGVLPVPSPAALEILRRSGGIVFDGAAAAELCTPTGAAILAHAVSEWGPMPEGRPLLCGFGAGDMDLADRPNVLRLTLSQPSVATGTGAYRIEATIDDMSPEMCQHAADAMARAGAIDVWWIPVTMKKARPGLLMQALVPAASRDSVCRVLMTETTTLGVRFDQVQRTTLDRVVVEVESRYGRLPIKLAMLNGEVVNAAPEYEPCRVAANTHKVALKEVYADVVAQWRKDHRP